MHRPELVRSWAAASSDVWHDVARVWQTPGDGEQPMDAMMGGTVEGTTARAVALGLATSALIVVGGDSLASAMFSETHAAGAVPVVVAVTAISAVFPMSRTVRHAIAAAPGGAANIIAGPPLPALWNQRSGPGAVAEMNCNRQIR